MRESDMTGTASLTLATGTPKGLRPTIVFGLALALIALTAAILLMMGRTPICTCGTIELWHGTVKDSGNSQHLTDWYTITHILHGFLFYLAAWVIGALRGKALPIGIALLLAIGLEAVWEIAENTDTIINRFRATNIALDYYGDSVINSISDIVAMMAGFWLAKVWPAWLTALVAVIMEAFVAFWIRDSLILSIIMLIHPIDAINRWQGAL
jgi:hypothetical protein